MEADNGLFLLGNTAALNYGGESLIDRVADLNEGLSTSTVWSGPLGFGGQTTTSKDVFDRTLMGVFDRGTLERHGLGLDELSGGNMSGNLSNSRRLALRDLLRGEGVMPEGDRLSSIKNFIALPADQVGSRGAGNVLGTAFHEIGHSTSYTIGHNAGLSREIESFNNIKNPTAIEQVQHYLRQMAYRGAEEGRAEGFGILGSSAGVKGNEFRETITRGKNIAYTGPTSFNTMYGEEILTQLPEARGAGLLLAGEQTAKQAFHESLLQGIITGGGSEETVKATKSGLSILGSGEWGKSLEAMVKSASQGGEQLGPLR
jgi:hypothetical protein